VAAALIVATAAVGVATSVTKARSDWSNVGEIELAWRRLLVWGTSIGVTWMAVLVLALLTTRRRWPRWLTLATFILLAIGMGNWLADTSQRVSAGYAPASHLIAPAALFTLAAAVIVLLARPSFDRRRAVRREPRPRTLTRGPGAAS
jgi:hypothetical protein